MQTITWNHWYDFPLYSRSTGQMFPIATLVGVEGVPHRGGVARLLGMPRVRVLKMTTWWGRAGGQGTIRRETLLRPRDGNDRVLPPPVPLTPMPRVILQVMCWTCSHSSEFHNVCTLQKANLVASHKHT